MSNYGVRATDRILTFEVNACNDAYMGLMSGSSDAQPLYEIDLGAYRNTVSYIWAGKSGTLPRLDEYNGATLHCYAYREFIITWDDKTINVVSHGMDDNGSPFLTWTSSTTLWPIQYIGMSTAYGATGKWIFYIQGNNISPDDSFYTLLWCLSLNFMSYINFVQYNICFDLVGNNLTKMKFLWSGSTFEINFYWNNFLGIKQNTL